VGPTGWNIAQRVLHKPDARLIVQAPELVKLLERIVSVEHSPTGSQGGKINPKIVSVEHSPTGSQGGKINPKNVRLRLEHVRELARKALARVTGEETT
jgi:hypothetical protein